MEGWEISPTNSTEEGENSLAVYPSARMRRRSSVDDVQMVIAMKAKEGRKRKEFAVKPLLKRNTIADFAASKKLHGSETSLLSTAEQEKLMASQKKNKGAFSLLKLIDKRTFRSKDEHYELKDVFANIQINEFKDEQIKRYKTLHWTDLVGEEMQKMKEEGFNGKQPEELSEMERKRREAVWELFMSECIFLVDHLSVLKNCYHEPLKKVQVEGFVMNANVDLLFGNIDELMYCSYTFCKDFINTLLVNFRKKDFADASDIRRAFRNICVLTRNGEVYHEYCLNYSKVPGYLEQLKKDEEFVEFEKLCLKVEQARRLQLSDLLISPLQHCTKVPLLLDNIKRYSVDPDDQLWLSEALMQLEASLVNLETKMVSLNNYERIQEIQHQILWLPITQMDPRAYIPDFLRNTLSKQPCERLLTCSNRKLVYEGHVTLLEISKVTSMYMFLFDDILLLTKIKKSKKMLPKNCVSCSTNASKPPSENSIFVVYRQPLALDRFTIHDVKPPDSPGVQRSQNSDPENDDDASYTGSNETISTSQTTPRDRCGLSFDDCNPLSQRSPAFLFGCMTTSSVLQNAFVIVHYNRFQQIIGVFTLQIDSHANKLAWIQHIHEIQTKYRELVKKIETNEEKLPSSPYTHDHADKCKAFFSNVGDILNKGLTVPSIEQLVKAPGIRSRIDSRTSKISKEIFSCSQSDNKTKWRSVSSDTQNGSDLYDDVIIRRTSEPSSNASNNFETLVECHHTQEMLTSSSPTFSKPASNKINLIQSQVDLLHSDLRNKQTFEQQTISAQSHHHIGQPNYCEFFYNPPLSHKPLMQLFPTDTQLSKNFNQVSPSSSSLYPSSIYHTQLASKDFSMYNAQMQSCSAANLSRFKSPTTTSYMLSLQQLEQAHSSKMTQALPVLISPPTTSSSFTLRPVAKEDEMLRHHSLRIKPTLHSFQKLKSDKSQSTDIINH